MTDDKRKRKRLEVLRKTAKAVGVDLTRPFDDTVRARAARDPEFREALLRERIAELEGVLRLVLRDESWNLPARKEHIRKILDQK
jgi:hypothetical protein